mgnify:CR=1 FL=1
MIQFKIHDIDPGFCRIVYRTKNAKNEAIYYALQESGRALEALELYRCTQDGEPSHRAITTDRSKWEAPIGDTRIEQKVRHWLLGPTPNVVEL